VAIMHGGVLRHDGPVGSSGQAGLERTFFDIAMRGPPAAAPGTTV
jgi:ABC-2 type transport system ATP-binding protein